MPSSYTLLYSPLLFCFLFQGCSTPVPMGLANQDSLTSGIVYNPKGTQFTISGTYLIQIKSGRADHSDATDFRAFLDPSSLSVTLSTVSQKPIYINPPKAGGFLTALPFENDANMVSLNEHGGLNGINFKSQDKSREVIKNLVETAVNVAQFAGGDLTPFLGAVAKSAGGDDPPIIWKKLGTVNVVDRYHIPESKFPNISQDKIAADKKPEAITHSLTRFVSQVEGSELYKNFRVRGSESPKAPKLRIDLNNLVGSKQLVAMLSDSELIKKGGTIYQYPGTADLTISVDGNSYFYSPVEINEAGGYGHIPLKSRRFGDDTDIVALRSNGRLEKYSFGRNSVAEEASATLAETSAGAGKVVATYDSSKRAKISQDAALEVAIADATAARDKAEIALSIAKAKQAEYKKLVDKLTKELDKNKSSVNAAKAELDKATPENLDELTLKYSEELAQQTKISAELETAKTNYQESQTAVVDAENTLEKSKIKYNEALRLKSI